MSAWYADHRLVSCCLYHLFVDFFTACGACYHDNRSIAIRGWPLVCIEYRPYQIATFSASIDIVVKVGCKTDNMANGLIVNVYFSRIFNVCFEIVQYNKAVPTIPLEENVPIKIKFKFYFVNQILADKLSMKI